ncbi:glutamate [NMDA] receptor subunit 1-like [Culicoides brevitarsis]|uniref:glutamate [NMDA] receptor subunit 1-like n=1 Tax=Culicoides brevitarsis TaxID=469753 RepID=UPI00307BECF2
MKTLHRKGSTYAALAVRSIEASETHQISKKQVHEFVIEYLKRVHLSICTIIAHDEEQIESFGDIDPLPFYEEKIYLKFSDGSEEIVVDDFGAPQAFLVDMDYEDNFKVLEMASSKNLFNATFHWILTVTSPQQQLVVATINNWFNELNIHVDSKITVVNLLGSNNDARETATNSSTTTTKQGHQQVSLYDIWKPSHRHDPRRKVNINLLGYGILPSLPSTSSKQKPLIYFNDVTTMSLKERNAERKRKSSPFAAISNRLERRRDMEGTMLRVTVVIQQRIHEPFELYLKHTYNLHLDSMHRMNMAILEHFRWMHNLTFHVRRVKSWGYPVNDTWDGMVGSLLRDEADLGGSPIFYYKARQQAVTGVGYTALERPCFFLLQPYDPNALRNIFLLPFSTNVWICILLCCVLFIFVMFVFYDFEHKVTSSGNAWLKKFVKGPQKKKQKARKTENVSKPHAINFWFDSLLLLTGVICQQGLEKSVKSSASRCFGLFLLVFGFLIYQFYSASIVSALLMEKPKTIKTLRNLIDSPLELYIDNNIYMKNHFKHTKDPLAIELYNKKVVVFNKNTMQNEFHYVDFDEGMRMIRRGKAFHVQDAQAYKVIKDTFTEMEICDLIEINLMPQYIKKLQMIVQKVSPFRKILAYSNRRITEHGIMARERRFWRSPKPKCVRQIHKEDFQVRVEFIYSVLIFLSAGYVISCAILLLEIYFVKYCNNNHHRM